MHTHPRLSLSNLKTHSIALILVSIVAACGVTDEDYRRGCGSVNLNPKLVRLLYWGYQDPGNWIPNQGMSIAHNRLPIWVSSNTIYEVTGTVTDDNAHYGIYEIKFNSSGFGYESYTNYDFPYVIYLFKYSKNQDKFLAMFYEKSVGYKVAYVSLVDNQTVIDEEIVSEDWYPLSISFWEGKEGIVFYGMNPEDEKWGFYWRYKTLSGESTDSLLYETSLSPMDTRGLSISKDGRYLFYSITMGTGLSTQFLLMKLDILQSSQDPVVIAQRDGRLRATAPHPLDPNLLLMNYYILAINPDDTGGNIELINIETNQTLDLDVRTHRDLCRFIDNDSPSWSPDGNHFVFVAGATDGEGAVYPYELWIYRDVP